VDGCVDPDIARKCHKCSKGAVPSIELCSAVARILAVERPCSLACPKMFPGLLNAASSFGGWGRVEATAVLINDVKGYGLLCCVVISDSTSRAVCWGSVGYFLL
jgi:hypothetical protein